MVNSKGGVMCKFWIFLLVIGIFNIGCSKLPKEELIKKKIEEKVTVCGKSDMFDFGVEIVGMAKKEDGVSVIAKLSLSKDSFETLGENKNAFDKESEYTFALKKYSKVGWQIEKTEIINGGKIDILELVSLLNKDCDSFDIGRVKGMLSAWNSAIQVYYGDNEGVFPENPKVLVPMYINEIPYVDMKGFSKSNKVLIIKNAICDDLCKYVTNDGGWIYG